MELKGKTINFIGDSITEGACVSDCENNRYDNRIKAKCELAAVYNYGISGTRLAHQRVPSESPRFDLCFCGRIFDLNPDADIIVVYGGTNDYGHGDAPFGEMTDKTPATFCGAVDFLMRNLKENYPKAQIVFMTPAHRCSESGTDLLPSADKCKNNNAKPLVEYVDVILKKGGEHQIPVLDLYRKLPIDANNAEEKEKYTADGLHFNDAGHGILADLLIDFLKAL